MSMEHPPTIKDPWARIDDPWKVMVEVVEDPIIKGGVKVLLEADIDRDSTARQTVEERLADYMVYVHKLPRQHTTEAFRATEAAIKQEEIAQVERTNHG